MFGALFNIWYHSQFFALHVIDGAEDKKDENDDKTEKKKKSKKEKKAKKKDKEDDSRPSKRRRMFLVCAIVPIFGGGSHPVSYYSRLCRETLL